MTPMPLHVVINAHPAAVMLSAAVAIALWQLRRVQFSVLAVTCDELQVVQPVVRPDAVDVMHDVLGREHASQRLRHHVPMFEHVAIHIRHGMCADVDLDVSSVMPRASASPMGTMLSGPIRGVKRAVARLVTEGVFGVRVCQGAWGAFDWLAALIAGHDRHSVILPREVRFH
jgi:hypothetical protein